MKAFSHCVAFYFTTCIYAGHQYIFKYKANLSRMRCYYCNLMTVYEFMMVNFITVNFWQTQLLFFTVYLFIPLRVLIFLERKKKFLQDARDISISIPSGQWILLAVGKGLGMPELSTCFSALSLSDLKQSEKTHRGPWESPDPYCVLKTCTLQRAALIKHTVMLFTRTHRGNKV